MKPGSRVLITGADGYVGRNLARALMCDYELALLVRCDSPAELITKSERLRSWLGTTAPIEENGGVVELAPSIRCHGFDLTSPDPIASLNLGPIETLVHCAARTEFNIDAETANAVNINGSRKLIQFAEQCKELSQFLFVSTIYSAGLTNGPLAESAHHSGGSFANHYERSKWQTEADVTNSQLPWQVARLCTIISDDTTGTVTQFNAVHNTLKLFHYGMLSLVPGSPGTPLYFCTGEFCTESLMAILRQGELHRFYNVSPSFEDSIDLDQFVECAYEAFQQDPGFRKRNILKPLYTNPVDFELLSSAMENFGQSVMSQASRSITPFARQLASHKTVHNSTMVECLGPHHKPSMTELVSRVCRYLQESKWGKLESAAC